MRKKNVAVVMGGFSNECEISLKSGQLIFDELDRDLYNVYKIHILREGWFFIGDDNRKWPIDKSNFSVNLEDERLIFDVCFNVVHGIPGENGVLQAYWDAIGQKYTGCDFYQSSLTFNKKDTLAVLSEYGIPSAKRVYVRKNEKIDEDEIIAKLGLPCFVKPNQSGSSLGISKVKEKSDFAEALKLAFAEDNEVLIESFLQGTEVSVGVVDYQGKPFVLGITEIIPETEFFDYQAKYEGKSKEITPARLDENIRKKVEDMAIKAYVSLNIKGFARSEYIIMNGVPYMLEMNTIPGFSSTSILPQQIKYYGIPLKCLLKDEVEKALAR